MLGHQFVEHRGSELALAPVDRKSGQRFYVLTGLDSSIMRVCIISLEFITDLYRCRAKTVRQVLRSVNAVAALARPNKCPLSVAAAVLVRLVAAHAMRR